MKTHHSEKAFTLLELLVVVIIFAILAAILTPRFGPRTHGSRQVLCISNQRQIVIALMMFDQDHGGSFPWQVSTTNSGSMELVSINQTSFQLRTLSNYLGNQTRCFVCPFDTSRQLATNFAELSNSNVSYFLNLDASANPNSIWTGDRFLEFNGKPINAGVFVQTTNAVLNWSAGSHKIQNTRSGVFSFGDGHEQIVRGDQLSPCFRKQPTATNRFCFP